MANQLRKNVLRFAATEAGAIEEHGVLSCGASNSASNDDYHYINVQATLDIPDPNGVYFEIDDQANGVFNGLQSARWNKPELVLTLRTGVSWFPDLKQVIVELGNIEKKDARVFIDGLATCLRQCNLQIKT